jgi:hypothetical protein
MDIFVTQQGYKSAPSMIDCVPLGRIIMASPEPTIMALRPAIVMPYPLLMVRVRKYLISLSTVLVVALSTKQSSCFIWIVPLG